MKKKNSGVSLFQYIIIISLIGLGVFIAYSTMGDLIKNIFSSYNSGYDSMNKSITNNLPPEPPITPGSLGGTAALPVKKCDAQGCDIDFGDFVLNGIPEDFGTFINSSGAAGGTEQLSDLLEQLATQMDDPATSEDEGISFREMANLGHLIGGIQKTFETNAESCVSDANPAGCYFNKTSYSVNLPNIPFDSGLSTVIPGFTSSQNYSFYDGEILTSISMGRQAKVQNGAWFNTEKASNPAFALVDKFDQIMNDPNVSANQKAVTEQIYRSLANISEEQLINRENVIGHTPNFNYRIDSMSGADLQSINYSYAGALNDITHLQASSTTNVGSAIVCATGSNSDTGQNCYNNNKS